MKYIYGFLLGLTLALTLYTVKAQEVQFTEQVATSFTGEMLKPVADLETENKIATSTFSSLSEKEVAIREIQNTKEITGRLDNILILLRSINQKLK